MEELHPFWNAHFEWKLLPCYCYTQLAILACPRLCALARRRQLADATSKGQLISKCPYEMVVSSKIPTKLFLDFCPEIFGSFMGASWKHFGASCRLPYLWYYLLNPQEAQKASRKPPGSYKKFQGRNPEIISLVFWMKLSFHKDILKLTDL